MHYRTGFPWFARYQRKSREQEVVTCFMIKLQSSQVGLVCLQMLNTLLTFFGSFRKLPKFWKLLKISEPSEIFGTFRTTTIKKTSISYIIFGMVPKSVLLVKILPKFSEISEHVMKLPRFSEGFRFSRNFVRKGWSARLWSRLRLLAFHCSDSDRMLLLASIPVNLIHSS